MLLPVTERKTATEIEEDLAEEAKKRAEEEHKEWLREKERLKREREEEASRASRERHARLSELSQQKRKKKTSNLGKGEESATTYESEVPTSDISVDAQSTISEGSVSPAKNADADSITASSVIDGTEGSDDHAEQKSRGSKGSSRLDRLRRKKAEQAKAQAEARAINEALGLEGTPEEQAEARALNEALGLEGAKDG